MKEKLTLLIALSITLVYTIGYICSPIVVATSFTEQKLNNDIVSIETIIEEETQEEQGVSQNIEENSMPKPPSSEIAHTEVEIETKPQTHPEDISQEIWNLLLELGFTEITAAGIMGNFVAEVGNPSTKDRDFDLDWKSNTGIEIGLCQWTQGRRKAVIDLYGSCPSYQDQLQFMYDELTGSNGIRRQITEQQYQLIINATTPEDAAYYFALYFERCHKASYKVRQFKAQQAYDYFRN